MRVKRNRVAWRDAGVEDADGVVFEKEDVVFGSSNHRIEFRGPVLEVEHFHKL